MSLSIVIEGGDAVGKQTQSRLLAERLNGTRFAFPNYESATGKAILGHLKKEWVAGSLDYTDSFDKPFIRAASCDALVFQCLQAANRLEILPEIKAALVRGPVVFDRYWQSAAVYGALDGLDRYWLSCVQEQAMPPADINILIDVPVEAGFERRPERRDRYESDRDFMEKVRIEYLRLWGWPRPVLLNATHADQWAFVQMREGWFVVNGLGTVQEVHRRVLASLRDDLGAGGLHNQKWSWNINDASWAPAAGWPATRHCVPSEEKK